MHCVWLALSHFLERSGLKIVPYYVIVESFTDLDEAVFEPALKPVVSGFLSQPEIEELYNEPELKSLRQQMHSWKDKDCLCFGLKHNGKVASYMWCSLSCWISDITSFPLRPDEAYLFRVRTMKAYRGQNLAPFLSYQLYKSLVEMGRTKYYSIVEYLNIPAVNFKKKLKAKPLRLCLYIGLFNKIKWNIKLKDYRDKL